jgi:alanine racemase
MVDLAGVPDATVGDIMTIIGDDDDEAIAVEDVARQLGAPSAAYWMIGLRNVPFRYWGA